MAYTPVAYTTQAVVERLLRAGKGNKMKIGTGSNDTMSPDDVDAYILDASRALDSMLMASAIKGQIPLTPGNYPEIQYAAPRMTAFLIYRDVYSQYRVENLQLGPRGWIEDAKDFLKIFMDNIDKGMYSELSSSFTSPSWVTAEQYFIKKFGATEVIDQVSRVDNQIPLTGDNLDPIVSLTE